MTVNFHAAPEGLVSGGRVEAAFAAFNRMRTWALLVRRSLQYFGRGSMPSFHKLQVPSPQLYTQMIKACGIVRATFLACRAVSQVFRSRIMASCVVRVSG